MGATQSLETEQGPIILPKKQFNQIDYYIVKIGKLVDEQLQGFGRIEYREHPENKKTKNGWLILSYEGNFENDTLIGKGKMCVYSSRQIMGLTYVPGTYEGIFSTNDIKGTRLKQKDYKHTVFTGTFDLCGIQQGEALWELQFESKKGFTYSGTCTDGLLKGIGSAWDESSTDVYSGVFDSVIAENDYPLVLLTGKYIQKGYLLEGKFGNKNGDTIGAQLIFYDGKKIMDNGDSFQPVEIDQQFIDEQHQHMERNLRRHRANLPLDFESHQIPSDKYMINGNGVVKLANGDKLEGLFIRSRLIKGTISNLNGDIQNGEFEFKDGQYVMINGIVNNCESEVFSFQNIVLRKENVDNVTKYTKNGLQVTSQKFDEMKKLYSSFKEFLKDNSENDKVFIINNNEAVTAVDKSPNYLSMDELQSGFANQRWYLTPIGLQFNIITSVTGKNAIGVLNDQVVFNAKQLYQIDDNWLLEPIRFAQDVMHSGHNLSCGYFWICHSNLGKYLAPSAGSLILSFDPVEFLILRYWK